MKRKKRSISDKEDEIYAIQRAVANERPAIDYKTAEALWFEGIRALSPAELRASRASRKESK